MGSPFPPRGPRRDRLRKLLGLGKDGSHPQLTMRAVSRRCRRAITTLARSSEGRRVDLVATRTQEGHNPAYRQDLARSPSAGVLACDGPFCRFGGVAVTSRSYAAAFAVVIAIWPLGLGR